MFAKHTYFSMLIWWVFFKESKQTLMALPLSPLCIYTLIFIHLWTLITLSALFPDFCLLTEWETEKGSIRNYCAWFRNSSFEDHAFNQSIFDQEVSTTTNHFFQTNLVKRSFNGVVRVFRSHLPETWDIKERGSHSLFLSSGRKERVYWETWLPAF